MSHIRSRPTFASGSRRPLEPLEPRVLLAAHVAGSTVAYATIQAAVNAAPSGGTVTVDAGTYAEQVTISKPLTVLGAQTGVDARSSGRPTATATTESVVVGAVSGTVHSSAFHVLANDVTIDGFTVTGETSEDDQLGAGIVIGPGQAGTHVTDDVVRNNVSGLFLANDSATDAALVQHCYFASNNNDGDDGGRGIYTDGTISGGDLTDVTIDANTFVKNLGGAGTTRLEAALAFEAADPGEQSAIRITNNSFAGNGKATLFFNTTGVLIQGNTVTTCQDKYSGSLRFEGDNNTVQILYNTIDQNTGPGVAVDSKGTPGDNYGFVVNGNNIYGNNTGFSPAIGVAVNFDVYDGAFDARGNYWGAPSGPGGDGPGTGDAASGGYMQIGGANNGWQLTAGGDLLLAPFATAAVTAPATPTTAPTAPTNLTAAAASATQVVLTWAAATGQTAYAVDRSADGGATYTTVAAPTTTTYADAGLTPGTAYTYRVRATNAAGSSAPSNAAAVTTAGAATAVPLTALTPTSATVGYGSLQTDLSISGNPITLRGTAYPLGLGAHAASTITYALAGGYATFATDVGIDDETAGQGAVDFQVLGDGTVLYDSGVLTGTSPVAHVAVSVAGVQVLTLVATPGVAGTIDYDHADWAGPTLTPANVPTTPTSTLLTGTVIGTAGSWANAGNTAARAEDGNLSTFFDAPVANGDYVGLDLGSAYAITAVAYASRAGYAARMNGGVFQASNVADFSTGVATLFTIGANANPANALTTQAVTAAGTYRYVRYLSPNGGYGNVAEVQFFGTPAATTATASPTVIGTAGSYANAGNTVANAVDGNLSTFFDSPTATGSWVGLDFGSAVAVSTIRYAPRSGYAGRMAGGVFQASTTADFSAGVTTLYTITAAPPSGTLTTVTLATPVTARYFRYLSPADSYGNVAEIAFAA